MLTGIIAAQTTDMQYIILFLNISYRNIKRRFRSIDTVVELRQMSDEDYWCRHVALDFLCLQEAVHGLGIDPHHAMLQPIIQGHVVNFR